MAAISKEGLDQFRLRFGEVVPGGRSESGRLHFRRVRRGEPVHVDPFLIAQAIGLVMRECNVRSALGKPIVWNEYRMILARRDFDLIRPLQAPLERDLKTVLAQEARAREAELVGELRVTVVFDEADELEAGQGVVRVAFVPTEKLAAPKPGEMTMRLDSWAVAGEIAVRAAPTDTVIVDEHTPQAGASPARSIQAASGHVVSWAGGSAPLSLGSTIVLGRPHEGAPAHFIALTGAGAKVNKQHLWIAATPDSLRIGRFAKANPVHVNGQPIAAAEDLEVALPAEISLSRGDFVLTVQRRP